MRPELEMSVAAFDAEQASRVTGRVVCFAAPGETMGAGAKALDRRMKGALVRAAASEAFAALKDGEALELGFPVGLAAQSALLVRLPRKADALTARKAGAAAGRLHGALPVVVLADTHPRAADIAFGYRLRSYEFALHKSAPAKTPGSVVLMVGKPDTVRAALVPLGALAEGVGFTRDLVNEPANVLTTTEFAARLEGLRALGVTVEVLDEPALEKLGMRALLGVGQGSDSPSKVVVMEWPGAEGPPLALVGKGVVFDTGGISIKPAQGMEEMTMDMGGAAVVAGVMRTLALRKAPARVVGLVGLVENMPDGRAQRPGDIVRSMKGDTIEIINTDAEGRLVLADVLWYAQERFAPAAVIDLATLTGAIIVALGHENAGLFANDTALADALLRAAAGAGEGLWRMPLGPDYASRIKSRLADVMNSGGRPGGAVTAAMFLQRFVKEGTPWAHLDIAGVTLGPTDSTLAPKGATGWGVMTLDRLVRERFER